MSVPVGAVMSSDAYPTYEFFNETCMVRLISQLMGCPSGFVQGSIHHVFFQLVWRPGHVTILQVGVLPAWQNRGFASAWIKQMISLCQHFRLRLNAQNVTQSQVANKLISLGFFRSLGNDYDFRG
jgi:hypothetical protein